MSLSWCKREASGLLWLSWILRLNWRPSTKLFARGPAHTLISALVLTTLSQTQRLLASRLPPSVSRARVSWSASCIIDKMCLGGLEWMFAVWVFHCLWRQAHKLKAIMRHVVCTFSVTAQTQPVSVFPYLKQKAALFCVADGSFLLSCMRHG